MFPQKIGLFLRTFVFLQKIGLLLRTLVFLQKIWLFLKTLGFFKSILLYYQIVCRVFLYLPFDSLLFTVILIYHCLRYFFVWQRRELTCSSLAFTCKTVLFEMSSAKVTLAGSVKLNSKRESPATPLLQVLFSCWIFCSCFSHVTS